MVSDMGMAFVRDNLLDTSPDPKHLQLRKQLPEELFHQILESGHETTKFDADWFVVRVNESAPKKVRSRFHHTSFPRENRRVETTPKHIQDHLSKCPPNQPNWQKFADFHLLVYVAKLFDLEMSYSLCDSINSKTSIDTDLEEILRSLG